MRDKEEERTRPLRSISDDQIVTEQNLPRRSFLSSTGALLAGAAGIVAGVQASTPKNSGFDDPKPPADPDKRPPEPDKRSTDPDKQPADPDARRREGDKKPRESDKKPRDADKKPSDPDKPPSGQR